MRLARAGAALRPAADDGRHAGAPRRAGLLGRAAVPVMRCSTVQFGAVPYCTVQRVAVLDDAPGCLEEEQFQLCCALRPGAVRCSTVLHATVLRSVRRGGQLGGAAVPVIMRCGMVLHSAVASRRVMTGTSQVAVRQSCGRHYVSSAASCGKSAGWCAAADCVVLAHSDGAGGAAARLWLRSSNTPGLFLPALAFGVLSFL